MRRSHVVVGLVVAVAAIVVLWKLRCSDLGHDATGTAGSAGEATAGGGATTRPGRGAPSAPASISGRVTRKADGTGIAGAIVSVARAELGAMFDADEQPTTIATTDATGAWTVSIAPATYKIGAAAMGFVPGMHDKLVVAAGSRNTVDLALVAGGTAVTGTVNDVGGGPIGGARVTVQQASMLGGKGELVALTAPDGRYQLTLADGSYSATASHEDYTSSTRGFALLGERHSVDFVLAPGGGIRGQVVSRDGEPMPGAIVHARAGRSRMDGEARPVTADETGSFALKSLESGAVSLTAKVRGFASSSPTVVELGIGEQVDGVRIVVDRAFSISGRVVHTGKPTEGIPGVRLGVFSIATQEMAVATDPSADDGTFEIVGVKPASYMIFAIGEGVIPEIGKPVEVIDKDVTDLTVEMMTGVTLSGRVDPAAIASIGIELDPTKIGIANMFSAVKVMMVHADSDETGVFTLRSVPPGEYSVVANTTDGRNGKLPIVVAAVDQVGLVVKLEPRASLAGRVVDANGAPVAGVRVQVRAADRSKSGFTMSSSMSRGGAVTSANGTFRAVGLEAGKFLVSVTDQHGRIPWALGDKRDEPLPYELAKGQELTGVTLTIETRDGVIRGVVVATDRRPVADAWVTPRLESKSDDPRDMMMSFTNPAQPVLTGAEGKFAIERLRRGSYELVVEGPRGASRTQKSGVKTGETVTLVLEPLGTLSGRVTSSGTPVVGYDLACRPMIESRIEVGEVRRRFTAADGTYLLERLVPGEYMCSVTADAGTAAGKATITSGPVKLDLAVVPWATITGVVVSALDGRPVPGLSVMAGGEGFEEQSFDNILVGKGPTTDANGRFLVERVPAGKGNVTIVPRDTMFNQLAKRDYTATPGQRIDLGTIKVVPPRTGDAGTIGLTTTADGKELKVAGVRSSGPAEEAGVTVGDRIVSIDGRLVADLGVEIAGQLVAAGAMVPGQRVQLGLERAKAPLSITLVAVKD